MWFFLNRLLQLILLIASAAALFVVGGVINSTFRGGEAVTDVEPAAAEATAVDVPAVEIRLSSPDTDAGIFVGQPLIVQVELVNLAARRADQQLPLEPGKSSETGDISLDQRATPWEERIVLSVRSDDVTVVEGINPQRHLLDPRPMAAGRRLGIAPVQTTILIDGPELAQLLPGQLEIGATLPSDLVAPTRVRTVPLRLELRPAPSDDRDRAAVSLAIARVAALRGESAAAIEAGLTALALDPLCDEALRVIAESWERQGDLDRALEWYGRYLDAIPDTAVDERVALETYLQALRRQR